MSDSPLERESTPAADSLTRDRHYALLADERRRYAVAYLHEASAPVPVAELARRVAQWESDDSSVRRERRQSVSRSLHHCHLPKLDDADVVEYDPDERIVEPDDRFDDLWRAVPEEPAGE